MPDPDPDPKPKPKADDKTFTQEQVNALLADQKRKVQSDFADYEDLKARAAKLKELEDAKKSDDQKLEERIAAAERKVSEAEKRLGDSEARAMRLEVASAKGLTAAQAKRLQGSTREELETDADDLLETFPSKGDEEKPTQGRPAARPREDLRGGGKPDEAPVVTDPTKLAETVPRQ